MDALSGRSRTTKGVWIAKALNMKPFTMVLDLEGTDSRERGEDDKSFEKQSALFALAVADIIIINIWCHDIGRENAADRPLLKTIFEVMMRLFSPRKATLFFVLRDKTKSPLNTLETTLREDVEMIWRTIPKPQGRENSPLSEFFNVEVFALPSYEAQEDGFGKEVVQLRQRISHSISGDGVPASVFSLSAKKIWDTIKKNKDLNLPAHKVMVAKLRCEEIAKEKLELFASDKEWLSVKEAAETIVVSGFGATISSILNRYLTEYDSETTYFEENVRNEKKQDHLESGALKLVNPAYINTLGHLRSEALQSFETRLEALLSGAGGSDDESVGTIRQSCELKFDERCSDAAIKQAKWDASTTVRRELLCDIANHTLRVRDKKLQQVFDQHRGLLTSLTIELKHLFTLRDDKDITWDSIRRFLKRESDAAASALSSGVVVFEQDKAIIDQKVHDLKENARNLVANKLKQETRDVLGLMKQRFLIAIEGMDCARIANAASSRAAEEAAYRKCVTFLSTMAVIRLDETDDNVESVLVSALVGVDSGFEVSEDPLASSSWEKVTPEMTLITPIQCKDIWYQFTLDIESDRSVKKNIELMHARGRCDEIAKEKLRLFKSNEDWLAVENAAETSFFSGFSAKISSILIRYLSEYDSETKDFEEDVRNARRQYLESEAFRVVHPAYINTLGHLRSEALQSFETQLEELLSKGGGFAKSVRTCQQSCEHEFDQRSSDSAIKKAKWDASTSTVRKELLRDIENRTLRVRDKKLQQVFDEHRERLSSTLSSGMNDFFDKLSTKEGMSWADVRIFLKEKSDAAEIDLSSAVVPFELDQKTLGEKVHDLKESATRLVVSKFQEQKVVGLMKNRLVFALLEQENVNRSKARKITVAYRKCLKVLSTMAVIRLDETYDDDDIESVLLSALIDDAQRGAKDSKDLHGHTWNKVPRELTLITPSQCKGIWEKFQSEMEPVLAQIDSAKAKEYDSLPYWERVGAWLLGVGKFGVLLWNQQYEKALLLFGILVKDGIQIVKDNPEEVKEYCNKVVKGIKKALQEFYDFMMGMFGKKYADEARA